MRYISPKEAAARWCISQRRVLILCEEGRIEGALRHSRVWLIPETAKKPADARIKSGRYIKKAQTSTPEKTKKEPEPADFCAIHMPGPTHATIFRPRLLEKIAPPGSALTYIHADAGYGKTTLLTQYAEGKNDVIWMSLDERDNNIIGFLNHLEDSFRIILPRFDFYLTDLMPYAADDKFVSLALSSFLKALGRRRLILILDDVHVIEDSRTEDFLTSLAKNCPPGLTFIMAGRHELWSGLFKLKMDGKVSEITKYDLHFNRDEELRCNSC